MDILESEKTELDTFVLAFSTPDQAFINCSAHRISIWGQRFATAEHAYQYSKFRETDPAWAINIKQSKSPIEAMRLAQLRPVDAKWWRKVRRNIMHELLLAKVMQHEDVRKALLNTGGLAIIEKSHDVEDYWAIGDRLQGPNALGKLWMLVRTEIS